MADTWWGEGAKTILQNLSRLSKRGPYKWPMWSLCMSPMCTPVYHTEVTLWLLHMVIGVHSALHTDAIEENTRRPIQLSSAAQWGVYYIPALQPTCCLWYPNLLKGIGPLNFKKKIVKPHKWYLRSVLCIWSPTSRNGEFTGQFYGFKGEFYPKIQKLWMLSPAGVRRHPW